MDGTSCGKKCPFVKIGFCPDEEECPNFVQSWWTEGSTGQQKLVKDCAPKRLMIQLAALQNRFEGVQAAEEQTRNEVCAMKGHFMALVDASKNLIEEQEKAQITQALVVAIENKSEK